MVLPPVASAAQSAEGPGTWGTAGSRRRAGGGWLLLKAGSRTCWTSGSYARSAAVTQQWWTAGPPPPHTQPCAGDKALSVPCCVHTRSSPRTAVSRPHAAPPHSPVHPATPTAPSAPLSLPHTRSPPQPSAAPPPCTRGLPLTRSPGARTASRAPRSPPPRAPVVSRTPAAPAHAQLPAHPQPPAAIPCTRGLPRTADRAPFPVCVGGGCLTTAPNSSCGAAPLPHAVTSAGQPGGRRVLRGLQPGSGRPAPPTLTPTMTKSSLRYAWNVWSKPNACAATLPNMDLRGEGAISAGAGRSGTSVELGEGGGVSAGREGRDQGGVSVRRWEGRGERGEGRARGGESAGGRRWEGRGERGGRGGRRGGVSAGRGGGREGVSAGRDERGAGRGDRSVWGQPAYRAPCTPPFPRYLQGGGPARGPDSAAPPPGSGARPALPSASHHWRSRLVVSGVLRHWKVF